MKFVNSPKVEYAADGKPVETTRKSRLLWHGLILTVLLGGIGINLYVWLVEDAAVQLRGNTGQIEGVVLNANEQPISRALVFVAGAPEVMAYTDENGRFRLQNTPTGRRQLIVVNREIGQEYPIEIAENRLTVAGALSYVAPPDK